MSEYDDESKLRSNPHIELWDRRVTDLQQELCKPEHADIVEKLKLHNDFHVQLAELATQLEVILDGDYDVNDLCQVLCNRLKERRKDSSLIIVRP